MYFQPCIQKENYWELQIFLTHSASPPFLFHALWHNFLVLSQSVRYYYNFSTTHGQENIFLLWRQLFLTSALASSLFFCICEPMEFLLINLLLRCCSVQPCVCVVILAIYQNWDQFQVGSRGAPPYFAKSNFNKETHLDTPLIFNYGKLPSQISKIEWTFLEHVNINGRNSVCL